MSRLEKEKLDCTTVIIDIRNFSESFKLYQNMDDERFLEFTERYYEIQSDLASVLTNNIYIKSGGDSILTIFLNKKNHYKEAYAYVLASHKSMTKLCADFLAVNPEIKKLSFGLGADSGNVWKAGKDKLQTYVGTVINRASRIEAMTKVFGDTTSSIGNSLYRKLVKEFYPASYELMKEYDNYRVLLHKNPEIVLSSKQLLLQYVFEMELKGIQSNAPLFRIDDILVEDEVLYSSVMKKLIGEEKLEKVKAIIS